jgi:GLPGLI family protein
VTFRFVYDAQLKTAEGNKGLTTDEHWLVISKRGISKYSSYWADRNTFLLDSLSKEGESYYNEFSRIVRGEGIENVFFGYSVFKNYPVAGTQTVNFQTLETIQYKEGMGQNWQLQDGDTLTLGYPCHKAICEYHGRTWTAWYAPDIPVQDGPWKLCGLPGLIMRAYDDKGEFIFNCVGMEKDVNDSMEIREKVTMIDSARKAHKVIEQMVNDTEGYQRMKYGSAPKITKYDPSGKEVSYNPPKWIMMEKYD